MIYLFATLCLTGLTSLPAAMIITQSGGDFTFTFDPAQSAPIVPGDAFYTSTTDNTFDFVAWGPVTSIYGTGLPVISNTLIDASGNPLPDSVVAAGLFSNTTFEVLGFGNYNISAFTVAGGSLTLDFSFALTGRNHILPLANYSPVLGTAYDPGTTGSSADLITSAAAIPEPSTYIAGAGFLMLGTMLFLRRRKKLASAKAVAE